MPALLLQKNEIEYQRPFLNISWIAKDYANLHFHNLRAVCLVLRDFTPEGRVANEFRTIEKFKIFSSYNQNISANEHKLDVSDFVHKRGIPIGRSIELFLLAFVPEENAETSIVPIYPGEVRTITDHSNYGAQTYIEHDIMALSELVNGYSFTMKHLSGQFERMGSNLLDGLSRFLKSDYGGAVMSFRKSIEAWRDYLRGIKKEDRDEYPERRIESMEKYATGSIGIISNVGLHAPSNASREEAMLCRRIALAFNEYASNFFEESDKGQIDF